MSATRRPSSTILSTVLAAGTLLLSGARPVRADDLLEQQRKINAVLAQELKTDARRTIVEAINLANRDPASAAESLKRFRVRVEDNKVLTAADRDAVLLSIRAKMPKQFAPGHVLSVAGAPSPVEREIEDARGAVRVELRRPASDVRALVNLLGREFPAAPERALKFIAA